MGSGAPGGKNTQKHNQKQRSGAAVPSPVFRHGRPFRESCGHEVGSVASLHPPPVASCLCSFLGFMIDPSNYAFVSRETGETRSAACSPWDECETL